MEDIRIKISTIARIGVLIVVLINQILAVTGHEFLPFTEDMVYQMISLIATIIVGIINAWYNNDITRIAILSGKVFDALKDQKVTEEEILDMLVLGDTHSSKE